MLPIWNLVYLLILLVSILVTAVFQIRSSFLASTAILVCIAIILLPEGQKPGDPNECLIGKQKKEAGIFVGGCVDIWHIYHILFWLLIGILIPHRFLLVIILSVSWEILEHYLFKYSPEVKCNDLFCGRIEDTFLNIAGYLIGTYLSNLSYK